MPDKLVLRHDLHDVGDEAGEVGRHLATALAGCEPASLGKHCAQPVLPACPSCASAPWPRLRASTSAQGEAASCRAYHRRPLRAACPAHIAGAVARQGVAVVGAAPGGDQGVPALDARGKADQRACGRVGTHRSGEGQSLSLSGLACILSATTAGRVPQAPMHSARNSGQPLAKRKAVCGGRQLGAAPRAGPAPPLLAHPAGWCLAPP